MAGARRERAAGAYCPSVSPRPRSGARADSATLKNIKRGINLAVRHGLPAAVLPLAACVAVSGQPRGTAASRFTPLAAPHSTFLQSQVKLQDMAATGELQQLFSLARETDLTFNLVSSCSSGTVA